MLADAGAPAVLALAPDAVMLTDAGTPQSLRESTRTCSSCGYAGRCWRPSSPCTRSFRGYARRCRRPRHARERGTLPRQRRTAQPRPRLTMCGPHAQKFFYFNATARRRRFECHGREIVTLIIIHKKHGAAGAHAVSSLFRGRHRGPARLSQRPHSRWMPPQEIYWHVRRVLGPGGN